MARRAVPLGAFATAIGLGALTLGPLAVVMMQAGGGGGITAADLAALRFTVTQAALSALAAHAPDLPGVRRRMLASGERWQVAALATGEAMRGAWRSMRVGQRVLVRLRFAWVAGGAVSACRDRGQPSFCTARRLMIFGNPSSSTSVLQAWPLPGHGRSAPSRWTPAWCCPIICTASGPCRRGTTIIRHGGG